MNFGSVRSSLGTLVCIAGAWAAPAALAAQAPPAAQGPAASSNTNEGDGIVVTGQSKRERDRAVNAFVRQTTADSPTSPMALYDQGDYCPAVLGMSDTVNAAIAARMMQVAAAAGVRPGDAASCLPSALVIFADDPQDTIARFRKLHPEYFLALTGEEIAYHGMDGPVAGWKIVARIDRDGNPVSVDTDGIQWVDSYTTLSRLESMSRLATAMSVLIVAKDAARGLTTRQLADFAVMYSLTDRPPAKPDRASPSILSVISAAMGESTPLSLTASDFAYLKARYSVPRFNYGMRQAADVRRKMKRALAVEAP